MSRSHAGYRISERRIRSSSTTATAMAEQQQQQKYILKYYCILRQQQAESALSLAHTQNHAHTHEYGPNHSIHTTLRVLDRDKTQCESSARTDDAAATKKKKENKIIYDLFWSTTDRRGVFMSVAVGLLACLPLCVCMCVSRIGMAEQRSGYSWQWHAEN